MPSRKRKGKACSRSLKKENSQKPNIVLKNLPRHLAIKIAQKFDASSFVRSLKSTRYMNELMEECKLKFSIPVEQGTLFISKNNFSQVKIYNGAVEMSPKSFELDNNIRPFRVKREFCPSLRFFSFRRIIADCGLTLYNRMMPYMKTTGIYLHKTVCPYSLMPMFKLECLWVKTINKELFEAIRHRNLKVLYCGDAGTEPLVIFDWIPHLAKCVALTGYHDFVETEIAKYVKAFTENVFDGKLTHLVIVSKTKSDGSLHNILNNSGQFWTGEIDADFKMTEAPICGVFTNSRKEFALTLLLDGVYYCVLLGLKNSEAIIRWVQKRGASRLNTKDDSPLIRFIRTTIKGYLEDTQ